MCFKRNLLTAVVVVLAASSCGHSGSPARGLTTNAPIVDGSRQHIFGSLKELATDSPTIVTATATKQETTTIRNVPFTVTTMRLTDVIKGTAPATFRVQQLGTGAGAGEGGEAPVVAVVGQTYLLFMQPYEQQPGVVVASDLFVTVGADAGMYAGNLDRFDKTDGLSPSLPNSVTVSLVRQTVGP